MSDSSTGIPEERERIARYNREALAYRQYWAPILRVAALDLVREFALLRPGRVVAAT